MIDPEESLILEATPEPSRFLRAYFTTGPAGSGKSRGAQLRLAMGDTTLKLTATTGVAATNLGPGITTVHSLLGFSTEEKIKDNWVNGRLTHNFTRLIESGVSELVIDECSLLSGDMLDCLYKAAEEASERQSYTDPNWQGFTLSLLGDLLQLPVIDSDRWITDAQCWPQFAANTTRLTKIWRQTDPLFLEAMAAARRGEGETAARLFQEAGVEFSDTLDDAFPGATLVGKNDKMERYNQLRLSQVAGPLLGAKSTRWLAEGASLPAEWKHIPEQLPLKVGALVMLKINDLPGFRYANGDMGTIEGFDRASGQWNIRLRRSQEVVQIGRVARTVTVKELPPWMKDTAQTPEEGRERKRPFLQGGEWVVGEIKYFPIKTAYAITTHSCLLGSALVSVPNQGLVQLSDLRKGQVVHTGFDKQALKAVVHAGDKDLYRIHTREGYILEASPDHRICNPNGGFVPLKDLCPGDRIPLSREVIEGGAVPLPSIQGFMGPRSRSVDVPLTMDENFGWFIGALIGDGSYRDRLGGMVEFHASCAQVQETWRTIARSWGLQPHIRPKTTQHIEASWLVSKPFRRWLEALGLDYSLAHDKKIPYGCLQAPVAVRAAIIRGLMDTDGHVNRQSVVFCTTSLKLLRQMQAILLSLGVSCQCQTLNPAPNPGGAARKVPYQLHISGPDLVVFSDRVGISRPNRKKRLAALVAKNRGKTNNDTIPQGARLVSDFLAAYKAAHQCTRGIQGRGIFANRQRGTGTLLHAIQKGKTKMSYKHLELLHNLYVLYGLSSPIEVVDLLARRPFFTTVRGVEDTGLMVPMWDMEVETTHSFVANGFVVSNSQALSLDAVQLDVREHFMGQPAICYVGLSRARTPQGLRVVGTPEKLAKRIRMHPKAAGWV